MLNVYLKLYNICSTPATTWNKSMQVLQAQTNNHRMRISVDRRTELACFELLVI